MKFGEFLKDKRLNKNLTMKDIASEMNISVSYLSDVEKGRRNPFEIDKLNVIADVLDLSQNEKNNLMNLAGQERNEVAPDIANYVKENQYVTDALRTLKDSNPSEEEWFKFIKDTIKGREVRDE